MSWTPQACEVERPSGFELGHMGKYKRPGAGGLSGPAAIYMQKQEACPHY